MSDKPMQADGSVGADSGSGLVLGAGFGLVFGAAFGVAGAGLGLIFGAGLGLALGPAVAQLVRRDSAGA